MKICNWQFHQCICACEQKITVCWLSTERSLLVPRLALQTKSLGKGIPKILLLHYYIRIGPLQYTLWLFQIKNKLMKLLGLFFVAGVILSASLDPLTSRVSATTRQRDESRVSKCCEPEEIFNLESMICTDSHQVMKF